MQARTTASHRVDRPRYVWLAVVLELFTAVGALPVAVQLLADPTGASVGLAQGWLEDSPFGSYFIPGLYLLLMNGIGMLVLAVLSIRRHPVAPWLTGVLGVGLAIWIGVQLLVLPEISFLQAIFGLIGLGLAVVSVAWLRRTGQLRPW